MRNTMKRIAAIVAALVAVLASIVPASAVAVQDYESWARKYPYLADETTVEDVVTYVGHEITLEGTTSSMVSTGFSSAASHGGKPNIVSGSVHVYVWCFIGGWKWYEITDTVIGDGMFYDSASYAKPTLGGAYFNQEDGMQNLNSMTYGQAFSSNQTVYSLLALNHSFAVRWTASDTKGNTEKRCYIGFKTRGFHESPLTGGECCLGVYRFNKQTAYQQFILGRADGVASAEDTWKAYYNDKIDKEVAAAVEAAEAEAYAKGLAEGSKSGLQLDYSTPAASFSSMVTGFLTGVGNIITPFLDVEIFGINLKTGIGTLVCLAAIGGLLCIVLKVVK